MSQHDYNLENQSGALFRSDLNDALAAIASENSGGTEPPVTFANMKWFDTTNNLLKVRNENNSAWIVAAKKDANGWTPYRQGVPLGTLAVKNSAAVADISMSATLRILGRVSSGAGPAQQLTAAQARSVMGVAADSADPDLSVNPDAAARRSIVAAAIAAIPVPGWSEPVTLATTSGTAFNFTDIPAGVNEIFVGLDNVNLNGNDSLLLQIGNGAMVTSGYQSNANRVSALNISSTNGYVWPLGGSNLSAIGAFRLTRASANNWLCEVSGYTNGTDRAVSGGGIVSLTGTLDRIRLTRTDDDTFVSGSVTARWRT